MKSNITGSASDQVERLPTKFAPAERADPDTLNQQVSLLKGNSDNLQIGNAVPLILLVLNAQRQIIYANDRILELLSINDLNCVYGKRPGELLNCFHATESPGGCGTTEYCHNCGSVQAILGAQGGSQTTKECRMTDQHGISSDFRITATPINKDGELFTFFTAEDIQHEKRRQALERTFFHDILNTAGGVTGLIEMHELIEDQNEKREIFNVLKKSSRRLIDEIHSGRILAQAENGNLEVSLSPLDVRSVVFDTIDLYRNHEISEGRFIVYKNPPEVMTAITDEFILQRVVANLVKNALEASARGETITVSIKKEDERIVICVHNLKVMAPSVRQQVFQRSFSTKGTGRGIGTYSIKLFCENYLRAKVSFRSAEPEGTTFCVLLPTEFQSSLVSD